MTDARNDVIDEEADTTAVTMDAREKQLSDFLETFVDSSLSDGYRTTLRSLITNYGKAEYGRGYVNGARDAW